MSSDSTNWKEELADDLGVDPSGIDLVDRVVERKLEEGELSSEDWLPRLSRRGVLSGAAGTLAGVGLLSGATGDAAAAPQWSNAKGRSGTEANPLESLTAQTVTTEELGAGSLQGGYHQEIRLLRGGDTILTTPITDTDPLQSTLDQSARGDTIVLPPYAEWDETGPIYPRSDQTWYCNNATVHITGNNGGMVIDGTHYGQGFNFLYGITWLGNLTISGNGPASGQGGYALYQDQTGLADSAFCGRLMFREWDGQVWAEDGPGSFQNVFTHIKVAQVDAGSEGGIFAFGGGALEKIHFISVNAVSNGSGSNSDVIDGSFNPSKHIGQLNIGGSVGKIFKGIAHPNGLLINRVNYEATAQPSGTPSFGVFSSGPNPVRVNQFTLFSGDLDYVYGQFDGGHNYWGDIFVRNGTIVSSKFENRNDTISPVYFEGKESEVTNNGPDPLTEPISCLASLTTI
jgi:hypothetical protein